MDFKVAAFYNFSAIQEEIITPLLNELTKLAEEHEVRGMILIAHEGINGTICGPATGVTAIHQKLDSLKLENSFETKYSFTSKHAFRRFKARRKKEIVTMGVADIDPRVSAGEYVEPNEWNDLIDADTTLLIDRFHPYHGTHLSLSLHYFTFNT